MNNMDTADFLFGSTMVGIILIAATCSWNIHAATEHEEDYGLGSVVTTTSEYEYLTNDSFTGVVVRGETKDDPALTVRNRAGEERRISTEFLEPMR